MLQFTFRHIRGFGAKKEAELWRSETFTWEDYERSLGAQLSLFSDSPDEEDPCSPLWESKAALRTGDVGYFATRLPHQEHFRIALAYPEDTMFLDIETTGLSRYYDKITLIGWSIGSEYGIHLRGRRWCRDFWERSPPARAVVTCQRFLVRPSFYPQRIERSTLPSIATFDLRFLSEAGRSERGAEGHRRASRSQALGDKRSLRGTEKRPPFSGTSTGGRVTKKPCAN